MSRGAILFAFNSPKVDYYSMAVYTAKRINHFLKIPVTIVTDKNSIPTFSEYNFDKTIIVESDPDNTFRNDVWLNKGRYRAYELSPYDETLLLDVDYIVNSDTLLTAFDLVQDYVCHETIAQLMIPDGKNEIVSDTSFPCLWATVILFKKTKKAKQLFDCMKMVQKNYKHYAYLYQFNADTFRNDFALTIAHRIIHGQLPDKRNILPWSLNHIWLKTAVIANNKDPYNTSYTLIYDNWKKNKIKKEYITITDTDFHVINKDIFMELIK